MLRDITIGQYYNTKSVLHALDPRTKIIALLVMMVLVFVANSPVEYLVMTLVTVLLVIASHVPAPFILRGMNPVWLLVAFTGVINLFVVGGENTLFEFYALKVTVESLELTISMMVRVLLLVVMSTLLTLTTSPMVLTTGIEKLLKPLEKIKFPAHEVAMMMSIALRFIPTLTDEADKIMKAQAARGNDFEGGGLIKKVKGMMPLFIPLFVSAFRRADELAMAMESRCYNGGKNRTSFKRLKYKKSDAAAYIIVALMVLAMVVYRMAGALI